MDETERDFLSQRTKEGLVKARAKGKIIGRPSNSFNSMHDDDQEVIKKMIIKEIPIRKIWSSLGEKGTYINFYSYCKTRGFLNDKN